MIYQLQCFINYKLLSTYVIWSVEIIINYTCYDISTIDIKILIQLPSKIKVHLLQQILYISNFDQNLFSLIKVVR